MPRIPSPNPDFSEVLNVPSNEIPYEHPAAGRRNKPIAMAFQVTSPFSRTRVLLPHTLVLHVNPQSLSEGYVQKVERIQTRGGWVEQHWGQDLIEITADGSTGAFMHIQTGLSSVLRQRTIAWDRYRDLHDLYLNNGSLYDPFGNIVLQGHIMLMYDRGTYLGHFRSFEVEETDDSPFAFRLNWSFKVEHTIMSVPFTFKDAFNASSAPIPAFQAQNVPGGESVSGPGMVRTEDELQRQETSEVAGQQRRGVIEGGA
jgi:hypothetical protein